MRIRLRGTGDRKVDRALKRRGRRLFPGRVRLDVRKRERDGKLPSLPWFCSRITFDPKIVRALREGTLNVLELSRRERRQG